MPRDWTAVDEPWPPEAIGERAKACIAFLESLGLLLPNERRRALQRLDAAHRTQRISEQAEAREQAACEAEIRGAHDIVNGGEWA